MEVEEPYAPLREGTQAVVRLTSLSGVANRYIALSPAPNSNRELDDGAVLRLADTTSVVDLDQLFNTFDQRTRKGLRDVIRGFAAQYEGKGPEANASAKYFNPFLSTSRRVFGELAQDEGALTDFLVNSSTAVTALAERREDLSALVGNANATVKAIGDENEALDRSLELLPTTLRRGNSTFVNLRATLDDLDLLVEESKPATRELTPFLRELRPLVREARPTIRDLRTLVRRPGPDNDAVELTRKLPGFQRLASTSFQSSTRALQRSQPVLEFARPYTPELIGFLRDFGQTGSPYDANGHYARVAPQFNAFSFTDGPGGGVLSPQPPANRFDGLQTNVIRRCPGAASQAPPDGSAPFTDQGSLSSEDCDPSLVLPGP